MWYFIGGGVAVFIAAALIFMRRKKASGARIGFDSIVGERCVVTETVDNYSGCGLVKVKGQVWAARCVDDEDVFEVGEVLHVVAIEGVRLICKK